jgi:hypothetical protein
MLDVLKGTRFVRAYETDPDPLLDESAHVLARGTNSVPLFCEAVEGLLAAADPFDFECCMIRVQAKGPDAAKLTVQSRKAARDHLCLAKGDEVWLFFLGCPRAAVGAVMQRVLPPGLDGKWSAEFQPDAIFAQLERLRGG